VLASLGEIAQQCYRNSIVGFGNNGGEGYGFEKALFQGLKQAF